VTSSSEFHGDFARSPMVLFLAETASSRSMTNDDNWYSSVSHGWH